MTDEPSVATLAREYERRRYDSALDKLETKFVDELARAMSKCESSSIGRTRAHENQARRATRRERSAALTALRRTRGELAEGNDGR